MRLLQLQRFILPLKPHRLWLSSLKGVEISGATSIDSDKSMLIVSQFLSAAKRNQEMECESIIESLHEADQEVINATDSFGNSLLMLCSQRNWHESCQLLMDLNCDVNHQNVFGSSALMCGASHGYADTVTTLLKCNRVNINLLSRYGQTALMKAAQAGKGNTFRILIEAGADHSIRNKQGKSAYDIAIDKDCTEVVQILDEIKRGKEA